MVRIEVNEVYMLPVDESEYVAIPKEKREELEKLYPSLSPNSIVTIRNKNDPLNKYVEGRKIVRAPESLTSYGDSPANDTADFAVLSKRDVEELELEKIGERDTENYRDAYEGIMIII